MALAAPWAAGDNTDLGHYDTPAGNIWRPDKEEGTTHDPA